MRNFKTLLLLGLTLSIFNLSLSSDATYYNYIWYNAYFSTCPSVTVTSGYGCHEIYTKTTDFQDTELEADPFEGDFSTALYHEKRVYTSDDTTSIFVSRGTVTPNNNGISDNNIYSYFLPKLGDGSHNVANKHYFVAWGFNDSNITCQDNYLLMKLHLIYFTCEAEMNKFISDNFSEDYYLIKGYPTARAALDGSNPIKGLADSLGYYIEGIATPITSGNFPTSTAERLRFAFSGAAGPVMNRDCPASERRR